MGLKADSVTLFQRKPPSSRMWARGMKNMTTLTVSQDNVYEYISELFIKHT